jgi:hypothetical protein
MVREALAFCAAYRGYAAGFVIAAQRLTVIITEIEFGKVAM